LSSMSGRCPRRRVRRRGHLPDIDDKAAILGSRQDRRSDTDRRARPRRHPVPNAVRGVTPRSPRLRGGPVWRIAIDRDTLDVHRHPAACWRARRISSGAPLLCVDAPAPGAHSRPHVGVASGWVRRWRSANATARARTRVSRKGATPGWRWSGRRMGPARPVRTRPADRPSVVRRRRSRDWCARRG